MHSASHDASLQSGPAGGFQEGIPVPAVGGRCFPLGATLRATDVIPAIMGLTFQGGTATSPTGHNPNALHFSLSQRKQVRVTEMFSFFSLYQKSSRRAHEN